MANVRIVDDDIKTIIDRSDIVQIIGDHVTLKKKGRYFWGRCPFHEEKTPSFKVDQNTQLYYCFGCGEGGNVFTFIKKTQNVEFGEAVQILADKLGYRLRYENKSKDDRKKRLYEINTLTKDFYKRYLLSDKGKSATEYLAARGFSKETISELEIGLAPNSKDLVSRFLISKGYKAEEIVKSGLAYQSQNKAFKDLFINRIIFPINDLQNKTVGFGGRAIGEAMPKYINSPETPIYHKSNVLYGLNISKPEIVKQSKAVVVEGYTDFISVYSVGIKNAAATLGTAFTHNHLKLIKRYAEEIVLLFDGDSAGLMAAERVMSLGDDILSIYVAVLPVGYDPSSMIAKGKKNELVKIIQTSKPIVEFCIDRVISKHSLNSMSSKLKAVDEALELLGKVENPVAKAENRKIIAERLSISEDIIDARLHSKSTKRQFVRFDVDKKLPPPSIRGNENIEAEIIKIILSDKSGNKYRDFLETEDFTNSELKNIFSLIKKQGQTITVGELINELDDNQQKIVTKLLAEEINVKDKDKNKYFFEIYNRIKEFALLRQINIVKSTLERMNPVSQEERYDKLFEELIQLEAEKRDLKLSIYS